MKKINLPTVFFVLLTLVIGCKSNDSENKGTVIKITSNPQLDKKMSDIVSVSGFACLGGAQDRPPRTIAKVVFTGDNVVILDNRTDFQDIWLYNANNGSFIRKIGEQGEAAKQYDGLNDIAMQGQELTCLAAAKSSFFNYSLSGNLNSTTPSGVIGDAMEINAKGNWVVYNEHSATEISGLHYLVVYDNEGNIVSRFEPYDIEKENLGYGYSGFLSKSDGKIWYSPPFDQTVYEVLDKGVVARYNFDFGESSIPASIVQTKKVSGEEVNKYGFINEWFVKTGNHVIIEYQLNGKVLHGIFNETNNEFFNTAQIKQDCLSKLISRGTLTSKGDDEFVLILRPEQVKGLFNSNLVDIQQLDEQYNGLGQAFKNMANNPKPILVYMRFK